MLQDTPTARVDWTQCHHLHTAVLQVVLATQPALLGDCGDTWVARWIAPICRDSGDGTPLRLGVSNPCTGAYRGQLPYTSYQGPPRRLPPMPSGKPRGRSQKTRTERTTDMRYNVLIVDDSKLARMVMASAFRRIRPDWTLVEATSADGALDALQAARWTSRWWISICPNRWTGADRQDSRPVRTCRSPSYRQTFRTKLSRVPGNLMPGSYLSL